MTTQSPPQPHTAVALIQGDDSALYATGAFTRFNAQFEGDARPGDLFLIERATARPVRRIGRPSSVHAVIEALSLDAGAHAFTLFIDGDHVGNRSMAPGDSASFTVEPGPHAIGAVATTEFGFAVSFSRVVPLKAGDRYVPILGC